MYCCENCNCLFLAIVATFERDRYRFNEDVGTQTVVIILNRISSVNIPLKISTSPNSSDEF